MVLCWGGFLGSLANSLGELRWCMWHTACFNMVLTSTASISVPSVAPRDCACSCGPSLLPSIAAELLVLALAPVLWVAAAAVLLIIPHTDIWVSGPALASTITAYCRGLFLAARAGAALFVGRRIPAVRKCYEVRGRALHVDSPRECRISTCPAGLSLTEWYEIKKRILKKTLWLHGLNSHIP